jgi:hypothetical protein
LQRYLLGRIESKGGDARYEATTARQWALVDLFLREVMAMKPERIRVVRDFADKIARWIHEKNARVLYRALFYGGRIHEVRSALLKAQRASAENGLLFGLDEYAQVWLHEDGDEFLVRDLLCVRVVETLHGLGYFAQHPEDVIDRDEDTAESSPEENE